MYARMHHPLPLIKKPSNQDFSDPESKLQTFAFKQ